MTKIKFKATPAKTRLTEGTVRYQGQLEATVVESNNCFCHTMLSGPLTPSLYWFVIASRAGTELLRCQRRIRAK